MKPSKTASSYLDDTDLILTSLQIRIIFLNPPYRKFYDE